MIRWSDVESLVSRVDRSGGYIRDAVAVLWNPAGPEEQTSYSRELAAALLREADEFFDRAVALFLIRGQLRRSQSVSWASVAAYYSNYFSAVALIRLMQQSMTHGLDGRPYEIAWVDGRYLNFRVSRRKRIGHREVWSVYYSTVRSLAGAATIPLDILAPIPDSDRFREQAYREAVNYQLGKGFEEIYLSAPRCSRVCAEGASIRLNSTTITSDERSHNDQMALQRISAMGTLLRSLEQERCDPEFEAVAWQRRLEIIVRYSVNSSDAKAVRNALHF